MDENAENMMSEMRILFNLKEIVKAIPDMTNKQKAITHDYIKQIDAILTLSRSERKV